MGAPDKSAQEGATLHPPEALYDMAQVLALVQFWRTQYEKLAEEKEDRLRKWLKGRRS